MTTQFNVTLAHPTSEERLDFNEKMFMQPKLDGIRCYITKDGAFSRNHKAFLNVGHILEDLQEIFDKYPDIVLDGELYNHYYRDNFERIVSLVRTKHATPDQTDIKYHIYDYYNPKYPLRVFSARFRDVQDIFKYYDIPTCELVDTVIIESQKEINIYYDECIESGYEGAMIRINRPYDQKRSHNLQKVKIWKDSEFTITGYVEGKGKFAGGIGKFLGIDQDGLEIEVPAPTFKLEERRRALRDFDKKFNGNIATFIWFERTLRGAYRFPKFKALRSYE